MLLAGFLSVLGLFSPWSLRGGYIPPLEVGDVLSSCGAMFCGTRSRGEYVYFPVVSAALR